MADRTRQTNRINFRGLNTRLLPDALPIGKSPCVFNVRAEGDSTVRTRPGYVQQFITTPTRITDLRAFATLGTDNKPRLLTHNGSGQVYLDDGLLKGTVGSGGLGASLIPYRPAQSPQSWMYVGNATGYSKFQAPDGSNAVTAQNVGIAEPQSMPGACPDGVQYNEFSALAASWTQTGTAAAPTDVTRSSDTTTAIFQDPASVSPATKTRYSVQVGTGVAYQVGETLTFTKSTGGTIKAVIEDVLPPINGGTALTISSIYYFTGSTGSCIVVPSQLPIASSTPTFDPQGKPAALTPFLPGQIADLRRGSLIKLNAEVVLVLNVTTGPQGQVAIETSTTGTHAAGETVVGIPAIICAGLSSLVVGQTVTAAQINSAIATGIGKLTQTLGTNPFNLALGSIGTPQSDDYIHVSLLTDVPANITELKLLFDVGDGSFLQNVLYFAVRPSVLQSALTNQQTQLGASQVLLQQRLIDQLTNGEFRGNAGLIRQQRLEAQLAAIEATLPAPSEIAASGNSQWSEILFPITALTRIGNDQTKTLVNCGAVQVLVNCSGAVTLSYGCLWVGGGGQPDIGDQGSPYFYRVRPRSALTGAQGNPSPATRYGVLPRRQQVIVNLPSASYDTQIDTWDIFRYGGTVTSWRRVGRASSTATAFADNIFDDAAGAGEVLEFDNFEPWPTVDVPWTATVGSGGITSITAYGTAIVVLGSTFPATIARWLPGTLVTLNGQLTYTLWNRPVAVSGGYLFRTIENGGNPAVTTLVVNEPNVANQPLPYLWGPDSNGVVFGCGDPLRPGVLYSSKGFAPDATPNNIYDLTPPSEPLLGGEVVDGLSMVASSKRWWMVQAALHTPQRWQLVETPAGCGLAAPFAHCTDGKFVYFVGKDGIYFMIPGLPAISLTESDIGNLFPHDAVPGFTFTYNSRSFFAPDYKRAAQFRLSVINGFLRFHYVDSTNIARLLILDMTLDSEGKARMAWSGFTSLLVLVASYQAEQPPGTLLTSTALYNAAYFADSSGTVYTEQDNVNDNGNPINAVLALPEWDAGDERVQKQWLDAMLDTINPSAGGISVQPISNRSTVGTGAILATSASRLRSIVPLGNPIADFLGLFLNWIDDFSVQSGITYVLGWSLECVAQPVLIRSWISVPTSHGLQGYQHIRKMVFAYLTVGANPVTLTITAFDGTSPAVVTLPATNGVYQKVEFVPTFNKGLLFTYQATSTDKWAPILPDCEIHVGQWARISPYAVFQDLGGVEAA